MSLINSTSISKVILIGDSAVGKTSIRLRYFGHGFKEAFLMTLGADFAIKKLGGDVLQIWDLAGQIAFSTIRKQYYLGTHGAILMFDLTKRSSFENLDLWINEIQTQSNRMIPCIIVGNKYDLKKEVTVSRREVNVYIQDLRKRYDYKFPYFESSAKSGKNIDRIFENLVAEIKNTLVEVSDSLTDDHSLKITEEEISKHLGFEIIPEDGLESSQVDSTGLESVDKKIEEEKSVLPKTPRLNIPKIVPKNLSQTNEEILKKEDEAQKSESVVDLDKITTDKTEKEIIESKLDNIDEKIDEALNEKIDEVVEEKLDKVVDKIIGKVVDKIIDEVDHKLDDEIEVEKLGIPTLKIMDEKKKLPDGQNGEPKSATGDENEEKDDNSRGEEEVLEEEIIEKPTWMVLEEMEQKEREEKEKLKQDKIEGSSS